MNQRITYKTHLRIVAGIFVVIAIVFFTVVYVHCQENPFPLLLGQEHPAPWQTTPLGIGELIFRPCGEVLELDPLDMWLSENPRQYR